MAEAGRHFSARRPHRTWGQRLVLTFVGLATVGSLLSAGFVVWVYAKVGELVRFSTDEVNVEAAPPGETANYLIVGSDSRENVDPEGQFASEAGQVGGQRADTIMLARIDPEDTQVQILSFPRDLWLELATGRSDRINSAYGQGRQVLIDTIQQNFGLTINHYVEIDFTGFERLVDAIGGVPVYLDAAYRDVWSGMHTPIGPGCVTLGGENALSFARARHLERRDDDGDWDTDPTGDLGRITRQQFFIRRALERVLDLNPFTNPLTFTNLLDVAVDSIGVDAGLSNDDLRGLAGSFDGFDPETIVNHTLPVEPFRTNGGAAVLDVIDGPETESILNVFRGLAPGTVLPQQVSVTVRNGTGADRQGANTADALQAVGFDAVVDGDTAPTAATTVFYAPGSEAAARLLARHLTSKAVFVVDEDFDANELELHTGADFTTVVRQPWAEEAVPGPVDETTTTTTTTDGSSSSSTPPGDDGTEGEDAEDDAEDEVEETTTTTHIGFLPEAPSDAQSC
jgi:LCP family protein required for cell wall assembly